MKLRPIRRALLSVSDNTVLLELAKALRALGVEMIATGGTRQALAGAGFRVADIAEVTGFPEILDGRVKTLHPHIHAAVLAVRDNPQHMETLRQHRIAPIDLVVCNLYPFEATAAKPGAGHAEIVENIDIGGPTLIRASAKNSPYVAVLTNPSQYQSVIAELTTRHGQLSEETIERLAAAAWAHIADYDR